MQIKKKLKKKEVEPWFLRLGFHTDPALGRLQSKNCSATAQYGKAVEGFISVAIILYNIRSEINDTEY
jgi:hypothetical protein